MEEQCNELLIQLNHRELECRLAALRELKNKIDKGILPRPITGNDVNNHIHTTYSFSPYSPTKALWMGYQAGLCTAGIMDHDSVYGAEEFIEAGKIIGLPTTIGIECRVDFSKTPLAGKRINNPDQKSIAYIALHGIPHTQISNVKDYFAPYMKERNKRNRDMVDKINAVCSAYGIVIDFDRDVVPISQSRNGGSITERHLLFALSKKIIEIYGKCNRLLDFLNNDMKLNMNTKVEQYLLDESNEMVEYDLLGVLKSDMVGAIYIDAHAECPDVRDVIPFSKQIGAISAYAYLGDVGNSITGDKKTQKFEDDYLDLLFDVILDLGFDAVTYMPSRNTLEQLKRLKSLCATHGFFEISGEDINSPRQQFICTALKNDEFKNLIDATWALIGHEKAATQDLHMGLFSDQMIKKYPDLHERIAAFKEIGHS